jgi:DNA-directed RNA polymerase specialized sigma24 family protein
MSSTFMLQDGTLIQRAFLKEVAVEELTAIIERARAGDTAVFGHIVARFQDMAVGYSYALLGDFHLAQDAAQEAFVEAYQQLDRLRE